MDVGIIRADERSAPFFEAAARDVLLIKRCDGCGCWLDPGATGCTGCGADDPRWAAASGRGTLISWAALHPEQPDPPDPQDARYAPSVLALVETDEGPWLQTRLEGTGPAGHLTPRAGMRVSAHFVHPAEGESYPVFRPG